MRQSSLKSILGIHVNQGWREVYQALKPIGFNYYNISGQHYLVEPEKGVFDWSWLDRSYYECLEVTPFQPFLHIYTVPKWAQVNGISGSFTKDYVPYWENFVHQIVNRYPHIPDWGIVCETNMKGQLKQTLDEFFEYILIPAARIIHAKGKRVIATGPTIQWHESKWERDRARRHFAMAQQMGKGFIDKLDMHSYGTSGKSVALQNEKFLYDRLGKRWPTPGEVWCSESGFSMSRKGVPSKYVGDEMLHKYQNFIPWLWDYGGWFERYFLYRAWDGPVQRRINGILNPDLSWTDTATYLQQELEKVIDVP